MRSATRNGRRLAAAGLLLAGLAVAACTDNDVEDSPPAQALPLADGGEAVTCPPRQQSRQDRWAYSARLTDDTGLVLDNLRFGPRLVARSISVPYVRIRVGGGPVRTGLLSRSPRPGAEIVSTLVGIVQCRPENDDDGASGLSATYRLSVPATSNAPTVTVLVQQSYRFDAETDDRCEPTGTALCRRFWPTTTWAIPSAGSATAEVTVSVVQRFAFDPDGASDARVPGAGDLIRDTPRPDAERALLAAKAAGSLPGSRNLSRLRDAMRGVVAVDDRGDEGRLKNAGASTVIEGGEVGTNWESWHQTGRAAIGMPGLKPGVIPHEHLGGTAGCSECVHAHWSWFAGVKKWDERAERIPGLPDLPLLAAVNLMSCGSPRCWTDGEAQILDGSRQTACAGWSTAELTTPVDWCAEGVDDGELDPARPPALYWDATSSSAHPPATGVSIGGRDFAVGDSYWAPLPDRRHGGNGSMFIVPARKLRTVTAEPSAVDKSVAMVDPQPGAAAPDTFPAGSWVIPVRIRPGDPRDQGPYYLRIRTATGLSLLNPDVLWSADGGGAPWVRVADDHVGPDGRWVRNSEPRPILAFDQTRGPMQAVLVFDRRPLAHEFSLELNAAPDGTASYRPATGDWVGWGSVNWAQVAHRAFPCPSEFGGAQRMDVDGVRYADLTGDGLPEAVVPAACPSSTAGNPVWVFVFDGAAPFAPYKLLLTVGKRVYAKSVEVSVKGRSITVAQHALSETAPRCCADLLITERYEWTGAAFELTFSDRRPL